LENYLAGSLLAPSYTFIHNRFKKSHGSPLSLEAKEKRTSDGLLSSENLKEQKERRLPY